jgi:hypothetical protein
VQFWSGYELDTSDLSEDATTCTLEDFSISVRVVVNILPLEDVINGSP